MANGAGRGQARDQLPPYALPRHPAFPGAASDASPRSDGRPAPTKLRPQITRFSPRLACPLFVSLFLHCFEQSRLARNPRTTGGSSSSLQVRSLLRIPAVGSHLSSGQVTRWNGGVEVSCQRLCLLLPTPRGVRREHDLAGRELRYPLALPGESRGGAAAPSDIEVSLSVVGFELGHRLIRPLNYARRSRSSSFIPTLA